MKRRRKMCWHGMSRTPEYMAWAGMIQRCCNPKNQNFKEYGHRGITICRRWRTSFLAFISDMGRRPSGSHSLGRIKNNRGYFPKNCQWETPSQQASNTRQNRFVTFDGRTKIVAQWAREIGICHRTLSSRLFDYGWTVRRALSEPVHVEKRWRAAALPRKAA